MLIKVTLFKIFKHVGSLTSLYNNPPPPHRHVLWSVFMLVCLSEKILSDDVVYGSNDVLQFTDFTF